MAARAGDVALSLAADTTAVGSTSTLLVTLTEADGTPITNADVDVVATDETIDLGDQSLTARPDAPGAYAIQAPVFAAPGNWRLAVVVRRAGAPAQQAQFVVPVGAPTVAGTEGRTAAVAADAAGS